MNAPPRQIYSSSLSRRERVWGSSRRRRGRIAARLPFLGLIVALGCAAVVAAIAVLPQVLA